MRNKHKIKNLSQKISMIFCAVFAVITVLGVAVLSEKLPENKFLIVLFFSVCYIALCAFIIWIFGLIGKKADVKKPSDTALNSIMYDTVFSALEPALICNDDGKIVWCNKYTQTVAGASSSLIGVKISSLFSYHELDEKDDKKDDKKTHISTFGGHTYLIERTKIKSGEKTYYLLMFKDITELQSLKQFIADEENIVAYIVVDNLEELLQFEQEKYREAAAKTESYIREWAQSVDGIVKEYEKDKYIFLFKAKNLKKFVENKFDILDRVRDIRVGSGNISVTLSIGVAKVKGEFADKEKASHIALDMALQRGGDQAVVKYDETTDFYGGRTNALHKRTKVKSRVVADELISYISKSSNVIIMAHKYPDYDAFGASCGMARLAMFCGVKVNVITNLKDPNIKKCMKFFSDDESYKGVFVDSANGLDLVRTDTLLIIVDVNNINMFESVDIARNVRDMVIIDHHRKTAEYEKNPLISYIESSSSSASEIVSEMLEQSLPPTTLKRNEANMLLAGIMLDTKQFTKGTGTKTYASAMYLKDNGASYENIQDLFKTNIRDYKQESLFGEKVEIYRHCVAIAVNFNGGESNDRVLAARVADNLLMVEEVAASFALVQIEDTIHISARSNGTVNVQLILEELNGGGRYDAAGAQIKNTSMQDTLLKLKKAIDNYLNPEE